MKRLILLILLLVIIVPATRLHSQPNGESAHGAWKYEYKTSDGKQATGILIVAGNFFSVAVYTEEGEFLQTAGGSYDLRDNAVSYTVEFNSADPSMVGKTQDASVRIEKNQLTISNIRWQRVADERAGDLEGAWLFAGRVNEGNVSRRQPGARKTMKILSGSRFQWIAYNSETGEFFGTGGGTYTAKNGKYAEKLAFFPRDPSRVGAELSFDYEIRDDEWHHKGKNSRGEPLYEIWSRRK